MVGEHPTKHDAKAALILSNMYVALNVHEPYVCFLLKYKLSPCLSGERFYVYLTFINFQTLDLL